MILDLDLEFLEQGVRLVDDQLDTLLTETRRSPDPDAYGDYDRLEYVTGLGFVVCQQYLTARTMTYRLTKGEALKAGPVHHAGIPIAVAVNDAANYWKHSPEWDDVPIDPRATATRERLQNLGVDLGGSYPLTVVLFRLLSPLPSRFGRLLPFLEGWSDALRNSATK